MINKKIKAAVDIAQRAQRNYDLNKSVPVDDLETLIYAAANSPSKQNEEHFSLYVYTDQDIIRQIYSHTKLFSLSLGEEGMFEERDGQFWQDQDRSVTNSQILANILFVYVDDNTQARGGTHMLGQQNLDGPSGKLYTEQKNVSVGVSVGQLIMSAAIMGYRTGVCSAIDEAPIKDLLNDDSRIKLLVGIGYEQVGIDRQLHAETLNTHVPPGARNGPLETAWKFPSFNKNTKVTLNGKRIIL
jgi:nitroreductase|tara:strand:- start:991 stop:1719 length:729 start_codon:yes stop_codon:yes gene_type:complete